LIAQKVSLQDVLSRQLSMFAENDLDFCIGQEIIAGIDDNGYLGVSLDEIARRVPCTRERAESTLKLIQKFDPPGIGARSPAECLLIQLELTQESSPALTALILNHMKDIATKNYSRIARALKKTPEEIESLVKKISRLDPKPGRSYCSEATVRIIPDVIITDKGDELQIDINNEDIPLLNINKSYRKMLKDKNLDPRTREFLTEKLNKALELMRAISKRKYTLRRIIEALAEIQAEAIRTDFSQLKPLTFQNVAKRLRIHESTVCRAIMNKYARLPFGLVAIKDFFSSGIPDENGQGVSSTRIKRGIASIIGEENKKKPYSDRDIVEILSNDYRIRVSRRTVSKYREEIKILSSPYRKER
ncbi:MAG: RNA polymerase factor sigma-54, partial [Candidatus Omnitrophica bacterium]|nr:RNA polymerase factor sigma-54 [Candidatus Omnitrophota bacterium]